MKKMLILFAAVIFAAGTLSASEVGIDKNRMELAKRNLMQVLKSGNTGARNSALHVIAKIKSEYPNADLSEFNAVLKQLEKNDARSIIRVNANLAYVYINSPELAERIKVEDPENPAAFFSALYAELNENVIAMN